MDRYQKTQPTVIKNDKDNSTSNTNITSKEYIGDFELNKLFIDFLDMRKQKKKPATDRAIKELLVDLEKLSQGHREWKIEIIRKSLIGGRQGFFKLDNPPTPKPPKQEARSKEKRLAGEYDTK